MKGSSGKGQRYSNCHGDQPFWAKRVNWRPGQRRILAAQQTGTLRAMAVSLVPASTLDDERLAALVTAVYAGYWHPIEFDAAGLRRMVANYDIDLGASLVALDDEEPVGVALLAVRDAEGWVGGMGVLPARRGSGVGTIVTRALLDNARARGLRRVRLEVLEQNAPAIAVYRKLGFADLGDVAVWRLDTPPAATPAVDADLDEVLAELATEDGETPWQRSTATIVRTREHGAELYAVRAGAAAAVYSVTDAHAALQGITASSRDAAAGLLRAPFDRSASSLFFLNGPADGPVAATLDAAGAARLARQHELQMSL